MPCWSRTQSTIKLGTSTDVSLLKLALESLGMNVQQKAINPNALVFSEKDADSAGGIVGTFVNGELQVRSTSWRQFDENALKRAYSMQVVQAAGKRYGWVVRTQQSQGVEQKLTAQRRY